MYVVCICVYTCINISAYYALHLCAFICTHTWTMHTQVHKHGVKPCFHIHICACTHMYALIYAQVYTHVCVHVYVCANDYRSRNDQRDPYYCCICECNDYLASSLQEAQVLWQSCFRSLHGCWDMVCWWVSSPSFDRWRSQEAGEVKWPEWAETQGHVAEVAALPVPHSVLASTQPLLCDIAHLEGQCLCTCLSQRPEG